MTIVAPLLSSQSELLQLKRELRAAKSGERSRREKVEAAMKSEDETTAEVALLNPHER